MAQIFGRWTNKVPLVVAAGLCIAPVLLVGCVWYYFSPEYTDVGYRPKQPIPYSHKLHAGDLRLDCRYCHASVEVSPVANIPPTQVCMNCHRVVLRDSQALAPLRESMSTGQPLNWVRVHKLPDYAYFTHSGHLRAGVGCASCHGNVAEMEVVTQMKPLSMSWCLDCHRDPDMHIRPIEELTNMWWKPPANQLAFAAQAKKDRHINPPTDCSGCHR